MSCGIGHRRGLDLMFLWLWCRLAAAALVQPLAQELLYVAGAALKRQKKKKNKKNKKNKRKGGVVLASWNSSAIGGDRPQGSLGISLSSLSRL